LSDDGKLFYTASGDGGGAWEFVWVTLEGNATAVDPDWVFNPGPSQDHGFSLSPDGLQIAVRHWTSDGFDIWVKRVGGAFSRLTFGAADERAPTWSPDGRSVTFLSDRNGDFDVWTRRADGTGEPELLVDLAVSIESVEWTPDGAYLLLGVDYGDRDVLMLGSGSSEPTPLFTGSWREEAPVVSPDGRWIAYGSTESGRMEVYVRPFPDIDAGRWQVSIDGGRNPRWAHDGTGIFFEGPGPFRALMVAEIQAETGFTHGTPRPLFDSGGAYLGSSRVGQLFRVAPDGERFLLATSPDAAGGVTAGPRVVLVNNFLEELRRIVPD
jgi:Tol biopolymer transport system component